jgi:hypothetical protein
MPISRPASARDARSVAAFVLGATIIAAFACSSPAAAQAPQALPACQSQQELEQVLASDGDFMPDGCRQVSVTSLESEHGPLCVIDLEATGDSGMLGRIADAALPTQWWVRCESLAGVR